MKKSKKKILLLGGEGFIGRNLIDYLKKSHNCFSMDCQKSIFASKSDNFIQLDPYRQKIQGQYDIVIHLIDRKERLSQVEKYEKHLIAQLRMLSIKQFIFFSSAAVYNRPYSDYAKRKQLLEKIYKNAFSNEVRVAILRLFNTYGSYQIPYRPGSLIPNIFVNYLLKKETEISNLEAKRDFIYIKDVAILVEKVINERFCGLDDLATNKQTSIKGLIDFIEQKVIHHKLSYKNLSQSENLKLSLARSQIVNKIKLTPLEKALKETYIFYKKNINKFEKIYG